NRQGTDDYEEDDEHPEENVLLLHKFLRSAQWNRYFLSTVSRENSLINTCSSSAAATTHYTPLSSIRNAGAMRMGQLFEESKRAENWPHRPRCERQQSQTADEPCRLARSVLTSPANETHARGS